MKEIFTNFENFAFRAFNFRGRATPLEYWAVVPLIWVAIIYMLIGDIKEVMTFLEGRQIPPMNPLFYESVLIFLITLIPRMSLNIRRLHDRNKSGFWIMLPALAMLASILLVSGLTGAMMNSSLTGVSNNPDALENVIHPIILFFASPVTFWEEMFAIASAFQSAGSEAIWNLLAEIYAHSGAVDIRRNVRDVTNVIEGDTGHTVGFVFVSTALLTMPFVFTLLHGLLNILPSFPEDNIYGPAKIGALQYKKKKDNTHNPMAGYAHLFEETKEEKARKRESQAAEVKALYRSRVLGQTDPVDEPTG